MSERKMLNLLWALNSYHITIIMKKKLILIFTIIIFGCPKMGICLDYMGNINFAFGLLQMDNDFSKNFGMDEKAEIGLISDMKKKDWPLSIAFDYILSYGNSSIPASLDGLRQNKNVDFFSSEMYFGVKKKFDKFHPLKPFIGAGIYTISLYVDISYDHDYTWGVGGWVGGGAYYPLTDKIHMGFEWRWSRADVKIFGRTMDAGGNHFNLMIGHEF